MSLPIKAKKKPANMLTGLGGLGGKGGDMGEIFVYSHARNCESKHVRILVTLPLY